MLLLKQKKMLALGKAKRLGFGIMRLRSLLNLKHLVMKHFMIGMIQLVIHLK
jgi:hypothetical protein